MINRKDGFYRVKRNGKWIIAEYLNLIQYPSAWFLTGNEELFYDTDFEKINENIINVENETSNWVDIKETPPTKNDANINGYIIVLYEDNSIGSVKLQYLKSSLYITHWMPLPKTKI
jgi:hypothetical protein